MTRNLFELVLKRPWLTLLTVLTTVIILTAGASRLYFEADYRVFFGKDNPQMQAFERMQNLYNKSESVSFVLAPKDGQVFSEEVLREIHELTEAAWQTPYSSRVDSITNFQHTEADGDDLMVEDLLLEKEMLSPEKIEKIRAISMLEPDLLNKSISANGDVTIVNVTVQLPELDTTKEFPEVANFARNLAQEFEAKYPNVDIRLSGLVMMNNAFAEWAQKDSATLVPAMFLAIFVMLGVLLRSITGTLASLAIVISTIAATMGISGWLNIPLTTATINVPTIVMTLAVANCVHIISSMLYEMRRGASKADALAHSLEVNVKPVFITSATTAIGFLALNFSYSPPLRHLGNLVAIGVMAAFVFSMTLLPALLRILPIKVKVVRQKVGMMERFAEFVIANSKIILPVTVVAIVALGMQLPKNVINDEAMKYFSMKTEFRQNSEFMSEKISGMTTLEYSLNTEQSSGINNPEFLSTLDSFTTWLRAQPETDHVRSLADTIKRLNKNMHGDDGSWYKIPDQQELSAQYLLMYEMSLPYGLDLNNQLNVDKSATRVIATFKNLGSNEIIDLENRSKQWFADNAPGLNVDIASANSMFAHIGENNMESMLIGNALALVFISVLLGFALKSTRLGFISLIPNILPAICGFGLWALISGEINLALSIVSSLTLGIVVDDTVHFLSKYNHAKGKGHSSAEAVRYAFSSVGRALWITTLVLCVGFGILSQSNFAINADLGLLSTIIIFIALLVDFLLLPAFLLMFDKKFTTKLQDNKQGVSSNETKQTQLA